MAIWPTSLAIVSRCAFVVMAVALTFGPIQPVSAKPGYAQLMRRGHDFMRQGKYAEAYRTFERALSLQKAVAKGRKLQQAETLEAMAGCMHPDYRQALKLYKEALDLRRREKDYPSAISETLGQIGLLQLELRQFPEAEKYLREAAAIEEKLGPSPNLIKALCWLGSVYNGQLNYPDLVSTLPGASNLKPLLLPYSKCQLEQTALALSEREDQFKSMGKKVRSSNVIVSVYDVAMVGSGTSFVLYKDNSVIFKDDRSRTGFSEASLSPSEANSWASSVGRLCLLDEDYDVRRPNTTDQPISLLQFQDGSGSMKVISLSGGIDDHFSGSSNRKKLPEELVAVFDRTRSFKSSTSKPWLPQKLEISLIDVAPERDGRRGQNQPIVWPSGLPRTLRNVSGDTHTIVVDCQTNARQVMWLFDAYKRRSQILLDGKRYVLSAPQLPGDAHQYRREEQFDFHRVAL